MVKCENGKIYKITGTDNDGNLLTYIGSTTLTLCERLSTHKSDYKRNKHTTSSHLIFECKDCLITLLELYPCNCIEELFMKEREYYDINDCVNVMRPYVSQEEKAQEKKDRNKLYYIQNTEKHKKQVNDYYYENRTKYNDYGKIYRVEHETELKIKGKEYRIKNADKIKANLKRYYAENKDRMKQQQKEYNLKKKLEKINS